MSGTKVLLISNYFVLACWWLILLLIGDPAGYGNSLYSFGQGAYAFVSSALLIYFCFSRKGYVPFTISAVSGFLGMCLFGLGTIFWFYYETYFGIETPFPSIADLLYVSQFPFSVFGLLSLSRKSGKSPRFGKFVFLNVIFVIAVAVLAALITNFVAVPTLDNLLLFYYPVQSFAVFCFVVILFLTHSRHWYKSFTRHFALIIFGYITWFSADCIFFYEIATNTFFAGSYADLLFTTGVFFILFGYLGMVESFDSQGLYDEGRGVYYEKISYYRPTSLNYK